MKHTINIHLVSTPIMSVHSNNGTVWLKISDEDDSVTIFPGRGDLTSLARAAEAFNAALAAPADEHKEAAE